VRPYVGGGAWAHTQVRLDNGIADAGGCVNSVYRPKKTPLSREWERGKHS